MVIQTSEPLVRVDNLKKYFRVTKGLVLMKTVGYVQAVDDISFTIEEGETFGLLASPDVERPLLASCCLESRTQQMDRFASMERTYRLSRAKISRNTGPK